ncbi:MAG: GNAT family N-acetyltransferase [Bacteroidota bacterium]
MELTKNSWIIRRLQPGERIPYDLLLLADPSRKMIDSYLTGSEVYLLQQAQVTLGILALSRHGHALEVKNVAVAPDYQRQGVGSYLLEHAIRIASSKALEIRIGTANSSVYQLLLYQLLGFQISSIERVFPLLIILCRFTKTAYRQNISSF